MEKETNQLKLVAKNSLGEEIVYEDLSLEDILGWLDKKHNFYALCE